MKKIIIDTNSKVFKRITRNAYDKNGNLLSLKEQVALMKKDPSSFGNGVVDVGRELEFINIFSKYILFSYRYWVNDINKHLSDDEACSILSDLKNNVILGLDYNDIRENTLNKSLIVKHNNKIYLLGLNVDSVENIHIIKIVTLYDNNEHQELSTYLLKAINMGKNIYTNKKSNDFLKRFTLAKGGVFKTITTINNYKHKQ